MNEPATVTPISAPPLLDLRLVEERARFGAWTGAAATLSPGLSVDALDARPALGIIRDTGFGPGRALSILSPPSVADYCPTRGEAALHDVLSLVIGLHGRLCLTHRSREAVLGAGDVCLVDGRHRFRMRVAGGACEMLVLQMPRALLAGQAPLLERLAGWRLDGSDPGVALLRDFVLQAVQGRPGLSAEQCHTALGAVARLLALPLQAAAAVDIDMDPRVRSAVSVIETRLGEADFGPDAVARQQRISRRRLDQLFRAALDCTLTGYIWARRLSLAEALLRDPMGASQSITQIALGCGFKSPSHFSRLFRQRHGCTPLRWRLAEQSGAAGNRVAAGEPTGRRSRRWARDANGF